MKRASVRTFAYARARAAPRKTPVQPRAAATVDAICEATVQVLVAVGARRQTTTLVAARAGVSVGTLYQYFPNKQALFYAVNERYLADVAAQVEIACRERHGAPMASMVEALIGAYWRAKTADPEVTRALYRAVADLDLAPILAPFARRCDAATRAMLATAPDAAFADADLVGLTLLTTVFGAVRGVVDRDLPLPLARRVHDELTRMCVAYLAAAADPDAGPARPHPQQAAELTA